MNEKVETLVLEHLRELCANDQKVVTRLDDLVAQMRVSNAQVTALVRHGN